jgi:two-component system response regulator FixJ
MSERPTVFIIDTDARARQSIEALVRTMHFSAETYASAEAFLLHRDLDKPGCAVVDLWLPDMNGIQLAGHLAAQGDQIPLIMTGAKPPVRAVVRSIQFGAVTFLEKPYPADELCTAIPAGLELDRKRRATRAYRQNALRRLERLAPQERQVLEFILAGFPNKLIAKRLGVSLRTIEYRRHDIFVKTETDSLPELVRLVTDVEMLGKTTRPQAVPSAGNAAGRTPQTNNRQYTGPPAAPSVAENRANGTLHHGVSATDGIWS